MLPTRQLGAILRGRTTRLQVLLACVLGGLLGFVPGFFLPSDLVGGFTQAPGLIAALLCIALIANANLAVFAFATLTAKLLSLPLLAVSYGLGTWLVDGPLQGLFRWLCNSQVSAWFGLEHYATSGGLLLGLLFGLVLGLGINRTLRAIRRHMAGVEASSDRYHDLAAKWWVRLLSWTFIGKGKKSWQEAAEQTAFGSPVRILGVVVAVLFLGSIFTFQQWFSTPMLTTNVQAALAAGNGATVDLEQAALHLGDGVIRVKNLALADRSDLGRDLFAADELLLTIDTGELLRRRFVIDEIKAVKARSGTRRDTPGVVLPGAPEPEPEPGAEGVPTLEDYLEEFELWRQRLEQARQWLDVIYPDEEEAGLPQTAEEIEADRQRQLEQLGYAGVIASHLFGDEPSVLIRKIDIEGITWTHDGIQEQLALRLRDVSSDPALFGKAPSVELATASPTFALGFGGAEGGGSGIGMTLAMCGLSVDGLLSGVRIKGENPLRGGTLDFECRGSLQSPAGRGMTLDLPLALTLRDATFAVPGTGATQIAELALPLGLRGSVTNPSVFFELGSLRDALLAVGKNELARLVQDNVGKLIGDVSGKLPTELQGIIDPNKKPEEMVDAAVEAAKQKLADEAKKAQQKAQAELEAKAKKEAEKLLPGLGGLFGGKKKE